MPLDVVCSPLQEGLLSQIIGVVGLVKDSDRIVDISFDILSLEALFLVPRYAADF